MPKFTYFVTSLVLFIIEFLIVPCISFTCIHDQVTVQKTPALLTRSIKYQEIKENRNSDPSLFELLNVHFYLDNFDPSVSSNAIYNVKSALRKIKDTISNTFQVRRRKKPFVLERQGCVKRWQSGKNRGKCSEFKAEVELCSVKEVSLLVPDRFLDALEVYDYEDAKPRHRIPSGPGFLESNFITFVTSQSSNLCEGTDVSAFASYCRIDPKTNEPLAGILNLCPAYFERKIYPSQHYYNVILHEMFHILGFSFNLFEKFLPCQKGIYCDIPRAIIQQDSDDISRMMFPLVIKNMQGHFNCARSDFGGPMASQPQLENTTEVANTSHWHPVLMYSSVMTATISEYDQVFLDNITLAVFGSTGWYRVNYSNADVFRFGKGERCSFGSSCENSTYLCDPKQNATGCDLVHRTIGRCTSITPYHPCGIYQPFSLEDCESNANKQYELDFNSLGYKQKCFMIYEQGTLVKPSCLPIKCRSEETYDVLVNVTWYPCYLSNSISVRNSTVLCPKNMMFCTGAVVPTVHLLCSAEDYFYGGSFMHILNGPEDLIISSVDLKIDPAFALTFSDHEGFKVLLIFPILCAIFLLATFVASLLRFFLIQRHKPQRHKSQSAVEGPSGENVQLPVVATPS